MLFKYRFTERKSTEKYWPLINTVRLKFRFVAEGGRFQQVSIHSVFVTDTGATSSCTTSSGNRRRRASTTSVCQRTTNQSNTATIYDSPFPTTTSDIRHSGKENDAKCRLQPSSKRSSSSLFGRDHELSANIMAPIASHQISKEWPCNNMTTGKDLFILDVCVCVKL